MILSFSGEVQYPSLSLCVLRGSCEGKPVLQFPDSRSQYVTVGFEVNQHKHTQLVQNLPALQETLVGYLGQEDPLEEGMATHSSILAWRIPMDRGAWRMAVQGVTKSWT